MLLDRYLPRIEFNSYEDFKENYKVNIPENLDLILSMNGQRKSRKKML